MTMKHDSIPTAEILQDIADTKREIHVMEKEEKGFRMFTDRWSMVRADYRRDGIRDRKEFVAKLEGILKERGVEVTS